MPGSGSQEKTAGGSLAALEIELHIGLTAPASHHEHPADLQSSDFLLFSQVSCGVSLMSWKNLLAL
jgi:hypothetical protein